MICSKCKSENPNNATRCIYCGAELVTGTKICPNGHIYDAVYSECPICPSPELEREIGFTLHSRPTASNLDELIQDKNKTVVDQDSGKDKSKTVIIGRDEGERGVVANLPNRKIVGWLVTFSINPQGDDYRLYEGRNLITGAGEGDIIIPDPAISSPHCMILYRGGKFKIKDELSTNGTFVNGVEVDEAELKDGDTIKLGRTELKFRTVN